jgi:hypothetical protein
MSNKLKLVQARREMKFGVIEERHQCDVQVRAYVKVRGEDAYRESTPAERAERRDARKRQAIIDDLKIIR